MDIGPGAERQQGKVNNSDGNYNNTTETYNS